MDTTSGGLFNGSAPDNSLLAYATASAPQCSLTVSELLGGMPGGFLVLSRGLRIHLTNRQIEDILGRPLEGEDDFRKAWPAHAQTSLVRSMLRLMEEEGDHRFEDVIGQDNRWVEVHARSKGGVLHVHMLDISLRKRSEAELARFADDLLRAKAAFERQAEELSTANRALVDARAAAEQARAQAEAAASHAEAASNAKSSFLANMSHEIRTPMTAIVGYAEMMLEPEQTHDQRRDCLQTIRRNARHLLDLINDILDISKIEAGKMTVERIDVELPRLVAEVVSMMRPRCLEKSLDFQLIFDGPVRRVIQTDPLRLRQILVNLLGNAVKFTREGMVILKIRCTGNATSGTPSDHGLRFEVIDTGIGIRSEILPRLFNPFVQEDVSTTREYGGTGLGLTISRRLAMMLGGDISVVSELGHGSTFRVDIDAGKDSAGLLTSIDEAEIPKLATPPIIPESLGNAEILLVEDGRDNQRLISTYLTRAGAHVSVADNGQAALDAIATHTANGSSFDLILMDMQMPVMDGYAATSELRSRGLTLPVIALTAHAMSDDRDKCLNAGCTDYLTKPIDRAVLLMTIASHLQQNTTPITPPETHDTAPSPSQTTEQSAAQSPQQLTDQLITSTFQNDPELEELVISFIAGLPQTISKILALQESGPQTELTRLLHQLKGSGGGFGFPAITQLAGLAETAVKTDASNKKASVESLINLCRRIAGYNRTLENPPPPTLRKTA